MDIVKLKKKLLGLVSQSDAEIKMIMSTDPNYFSSEVNLNILTYCLSLLISRRKFSHDQRSLVKEVLLGVLSHPDIDPNDDGLSIMPKYPIKMVLDNIRIPEFEEIFDMLLEAGAYVNIKTHYMGNYFIQMICAGRTSCAMKLLIWGANPYYNTIDIANEFCPLQILVGHELNHMLLIVLMRPYDFFDLRYIYETHGYNESSLKLISDVILFEGKKNLIQYMDPLLKTRVIRLTENLRTETNRELNLSLLREEFVFDSDLHQGPMSIYLRQNIFMLIEFECTVLSLCSVNMNTLNVDFNASLPYKYVYCYHFVKHMIETNEELIRDIWISILRMVFESK